MSFDKILSLSRIWFPCVYPQPNKCDLVIASSYNIDDARRYYTWSPVFTKNSAANPC